MHFINNPECSHTSLAAVEKWRSLMIPIVWTLAQNQMTLWKLSTSRSIQKAFFSHIYFLVLRFILSLCVHCFACHSCSHFSHHSSQPFSLHSLLNGALCILNAKSRSSCTSSSLLVPPSIWSSVLDDFWCLDSLVFVLKVFFIASCVQPRHSDWIKFVWMKFLPKFIRLKSNQNGYQRAIYNR